MAARTIGMNVMVTAIRWMFRWLVGIIFLAAAVPKIVNPYHFLLQVYRYNIVNAFAGRMTAALIPWAELVIGCCLIAGCCVRAALIFTVILLGIFLTAQFYAIYNHIDATCACFDLNSQVSISYLTVTRDLVILLIASAALYLNLKRIRSGGESAE